MSPMALKEGLAVGALFNLAACNTGDPSEQRITDQCALNSAEITAVIQGYPTDPSEFTSRFQERLDMAVDIFRLRYFSDLTTDQSLRFRSDLLSYLTRKKLITRVCIMTVDPKLVVDFVDTFVFENPGYLNPETFPPVPNGNYNEARFSTLPIWRNEDLAPIIVNTLRYEDAVDRMRPNHWPLEYFEVHQRSNTSTPLTYNDPLMDLSYDFTIGFGACEPEIFHEFCGELLLVGRSNSDQDYTLPGAVEGIHAYLKARGECFGRC